MSQGKEKKRKNNKGCKIAIKNRLVKKIKIQTRF